MPRIIAPALLALLVGSFQNCSHAEFSTTNDSSSAVGASIKAFRPALAIRQNACLSCHAVIRGNYITDFHQVGGVAQFDRSVTINGNPTTEPLGEYMFGDYKSYGSDRLGQTSSIESTMYVPQVALSADVGSAAAADFAAQKSQSIAQLTGDPNYAQFTQPVLSAVALTAPQSIAEYLNTMLNGRTPAFRQFLSQYKNFAATGAAYPDTPIREVRSVTISAPTAAELRAQIKSGLPFTYYPTNANFALSGLIAANQGLYYKNDPSAPLSCDGDLFIDAPVVLTNLQLKTENGCRIYATGSVFIQTSAAANGGQGIAFLGGVSPNLQISSSTAIELGLGACDGELPANTDPSDFNSMYTRTMENRTYETLVSAYADYKNIGGNAVLSDAGKCTAPATDPARAISFKHVLLNAPRIDSRYTADFTGVIIADMFMGALGHVIYDYDPVFDAVSILPRLSAASVFDVELCTQTKAIDSNLTVCQ